MALPSEDSNQPGHKPSLLQVFSVILGGGGGGGVAKGLSFIHADSKNSDETEWMPRLIRVFA